jgi:hypothetical protein
MHHDPMGDQLSQDPLGERCQAHARALGLVIAALRPLVREAAVLETDIELARLDAESRIAAGVSTWQDAERLSSTLLEESGLSEARDELARLVGELEPDEYALDEHVDALVCEAAGWLGGHNDPIVEGANRSASLELLAARRDDPRTH